MIKILFLIHDLGGGGAEKVLVNLVNHMDRTKFDISVIVLFGGGINEKYLKKDIHFHAVFPRMIIGNSKWMKLLSPRQLHKICIKDQYDIEVSFLEGPSARIISGCTCAKTKLICWIHSVHNSPSQVAKSFRNISEAEACYQRFHRINYVSGQVRQSFINSLGITNLDKISRVLYNPIDSESIIKLSKLDYTIEKKEDVINIISMGTLKPVKGYDRLIQAVSKLYQSMRNFHVTVLGSGPEANVYGTMINERKLKDVISFAGYVENPYKYLKNSDIYICSSYSEGYSTAVTEALILGVPVCTTDVSGMRDLLGENGEYGLIVDNTTEGIYEGLKRLITNDCLREHLRKQAVIRGKHFSLNNSINEIEQSFLEISDINDVRVER